MPAPVPPPDLDPLPLPELLATLVPPAELAAQVARALAEDLGVAGDVTSLATVPADARAQAVVRAREPGVVAGVPVALEVLAQAAPGARAIVHAPDGTRINAGDAAIVIEGPLRGILAAERTLLNYLGLLSGTATLTDRYVTVAAGTRARICDTRKTIPGLRMLQKYAVRCGGGMNHRIGLFDAVLVKDNHVAGQDPAAMAANVARAAADARGRWPLRFVEVECDTLPQVEAVLALPAGTGDIVLLDNMDTFALATAVRLRDERAPGVRLEASGGVTLDTVGAIARTGVDRISSGALTHSARQLDFGLDIDAAAAAPAVTAAP